MSSSVPRQPLPFTGGVNRRLDPTLIRDDEAVELKNLWPASPRGPVQTRPALGMAREHWWFSPNAEPAKADQILWHDWLNGMLVAYVRRQRTTTPFDTLFVAAAPVDPATASFNQFTVPDASSTVWSVRVNNKIYFMNGAGFYVIDGDTLVPGLGGGDPVPDIRLVSIGMFPKLAINVRNRMWYANLGVGRSNRIAVADRFLQEQVPSESFWFDVGVAEEGEITGIVEVATTSGGSGETNAIIVFKRLAAYLVYGEPAQSTDTGSSTDWRLGTLSIQKMQGQTGCVSQRSIATSPRGTFWLGADDVWFMPIGGSPYAVGTKISSAISAVDESREQLMYGTYIDGVYRVSADNAEMAVVDSFGSPAPPYEEWWLDCRAPSGEEDTGIPANADEARWFGPQRYTPGSAGVVGAEMAGILYAKTVKQTDGSLAHEMAVAASMPGETGSPLYYTEGFFIVHVGFDAPFDSAYPVHRHVPYMADTDYAVGDVIYPGEVVQTTGNSNGLPDGPRQVFSRWRCIVAGRSSAIVDPATFDAVGTVTEGTSQWTREWSAVGTRRLNYCVSQALMFPIEWAIVTKEYDFGEPVIEKLIQGVELVHSNPHRVPLKVTSIIDPATITFDTAVPPMAVLDQAVVQLDNTLALGAGQRKWVLDYVPLDIGGTRRLVASTAQLRLERDITKAIYIDTSNNTLEVFMDSADYILSIAPGWYASINGLLTAIQAQMLAVVSPNMSIVFNNARVGVYTNFDSGLSGVGRVVGGPPSLPSSARMMALLGFTPTRSIVMVSLPTGLGFGLGAIGCWAPQSPIIFTPSTMKVRDMQLRVRPFTRRFKRQ